MSEDQKRADRELTRLWKVRGNAQQMCADRGYEISTDEIEMTYDEFKRKFQMQDGILDRRNLSFRAIPSEEMLAKYTDPPTAKVPDPKPQIGTIRIEFAPDGQIGTKELRTYIHTLHDENFYTGIFITKEPITSMGNRFLQGNQEFKPPGGIETFSDQDLLVNISRHELVPKHILLSKEEKTALLERYRLKETQLPRMQVTDPMARYMGLRRGQVVKIIRPSQTAGRYASYRWVI
ncbi:DNA-directed RNA polymerases I [Pseudovirgaria hyperparasitica]|uniref:DNA-directed RNA polymerases I, II, and III subunit RPABC1 n=1 Tax=Pseudovirgaria hyperparasitica TaxID=470096 RepID=A0A6A6VYR5_9PEZI|nr:DNA-directed RNA polymerases I [Pseudovirgaria hyperparasitica]KAF2755782.1 DNA-directed RNA polymerases I [Pseudovirgaria hyperparasitica]